MVTNSFASEGATAYSGRQTFDFEATLFNLGGDESLLQLLVNMVAEDIPSEIAEIKSRIDSGEATEVQLHAHTLKGLCSTFSAEPMRSLAHELELGAKAGRPINDLKKLANEIQYLEQPTVQELKRSASLFLESSSH